MNKGGKKIVAQNKKALHDYFVEESFEAGIELFGTEVKSIREGRINFRDSYCYVDKGELFVTGFHISPYEKGNIFNKDPLRLKRLLMHKKEITKMYYYVSKDGYTLVPLSVYFLHSRVKLEIGLCKGKKLYDKRDDMAERSQKRESERYEKERGREN
ncbi:MAG: SsrA-binding protein SmpB [Oscillospiraceae bacterium]|nr:SsrA-binding protein SmpB [Oscillospiraceae bacterium]